MRRVLSRAGWLDQVLAVVSHFFHVSCLIHVFGGKDFIIFYPLLLDILVVVRGLWMVPKSQAVFFSGLGDPEVYPRNDGILVMLRKDPRWFRPDQSWGFVSQWQ